MGYISHHFHGVETFGRRTMMPCSKTYPQTEMKWILASRRALASPARYVPDTHRTEICTVFLLDFTEFFS
jgi:hypothetical protein